MGDNYSQLISRIAESSGKSVEEIERRIEAKRAKLSGLVSKDGAAQIVAAELGINFDQERLKISEIVHGMRRANVIGKVLEVYPVREYSKNGREGKVCNFRLADESSNTRAVLWDTNHIDLVEKGKIKVGDVVEISNANVRNGELHLSSFSEIKKSKEEMKEVVTQKVFGTRQLKEVRPGESIKVRGFIVQVFEPRYFEINAQTGRKPTEEDRKNGVEIKKRALLNIVLDDGTETIRSVLFGEQINKLGLDDGDIFDLVRFAEKKNGLLGEEKFFSGNVRDNKLYNTTEFTIEDVEEIKPDELIKELEAS